MSVQAALDFMQKVNDDEALYVRVKNLSKGDLAGLRDLAAEAGFSFDDAHWRAAVADAQGELQESELDAVSGGMLNVNPRLRPPASFPPVLRSFTRGSSCGASCSTVITCWVAKKT